ncbi:hypothetical protein ACJX0J_025066 [Zea mays]
MHSKQINTSVDHLWVSIIISVQPVTDCNGRLFFIAEDTMNYELLDDDEEEPSIVDPSRGDLSEREAFVAAHHNLGDKPQTFFAEILHIEITNSGLALIKELDGEVGGILGTTTFRFYTE